jgi:hypothetical protein
MNTKNDAIVYQQFNFSSHLLIPAHVIYCEILVIKCNRFIQDPDLQSRPNRVYDFAELDNSNAAKGFPTSFLHGRCHAIDTIEAKASFAVICGSHGREPQDKA